MHRLKKNLKKPGNCAQQRRADCLVRKGEKKERKEKKFYLSSQNKLCPTGRREIKMESLKELAFSNVCPAGDAEEIKLYIYIYIEQELSLKMPS